MSSSTQLSGYQRQTRALLSIRPRFAEAILRGEKRYEFRRTVFSHEVSVVLVYVTTPVQRVVAEFDVVSVISEALPVLWRRTRTLAGIDEDTFYEYFNGRERGHAIAIGDVRVFDRPFCPKKRLGIRPPQSFAYIDKVPPRLSHGRGRPSRSARDRA